MCQQYTSIDLVKSCFGSNELLCVQALCIFLQGSYNVQVHVGCCVQGSYNVQVHVGCCVQESYNVQVHVGCCVQGSYNVQVHVGCCVQGSYNVQVHVGCCGLFGIYSSPQHRVVED